MEVGLQYGVHFLNMWNA